MGTSHSILSVFAVLVIQPPSICPSIVYLPIHPSTHLLYVLFLWSTLTDTPSKTKTPKQKVRVHNDSKASQCSQMGPQILPWEEPLRTLRTRTQKSGEEKWRTKIAHPSCPQGHQPCVLCQSSLRTWRIVDGARDAHPSFQPNRCFSVAPRSLWVQPFY